MEIFCISPLSANAQCKTLLEVSIVVKNLVACITYLRPAIERNRIRLIYDSYIEQRQLKADQNFKASISDVDPDVKRLWYLYTRNRAEIASSDLVALVIKPQQVANCAMDKISRDLIQPDSLWLSFGQHTWNEAHEFKVTAAGMQEITVKNAHHLDSLRQLLPRYEPSQKHRQYPYYANGEYVSPMILVEDEAQRLLLTSVHDGSDRWAYHEGQRKYYRYKLTHNDQCVYHGFEVKQEDVPKRIGNQLQN